MYELSLESSFLCSSHWKRKCAYTSSTNHQRKECELSTLNLLQGKRRYFFSYSVSFQTVVCIPQKQCSVNEVSPLPLLSLSEYRITLSFYGELNKTPQTFSFSFLSLPSVNSGAESQYYSYTITGDCDILSLASKSSPFRITERVESHLCRENNSGETQEH